MRFRNNVLEKVRRLFVMILLAVMGWGWGQNLWKLRERGGDEDRTCGSCGDGVGTGTIPGWGGDGDK